MKRTSKEYRKELDDCKSKIESLEINIKSRLVKMIKQFPEATLIKGNMDGNSIKAKHVKEDWISSLTTDDMITYIGAIEEHNLSLQPYVQLELQY